MPWSASAVPTCLTCWDATLTAPGWMMPEHRMAQGWRPHRVALDDHATVGFLAARKTHQVFLSLLSRASDDSSPLRFLLALMINQ